jgi:thiol-disulfide isomerase/thioredoxin
LSAEHELCQSIEGKVLPPFDPGQVCLLPVLKRGADRLWAVQKLIAVLVWCLSLALSTACAATPGEIPIGGVLPEARLQGLLGPSRKLSDFQGKPLIINVWASWCGPCRQEMASLERLYLQHRKARTFNLIGISTDDDRRKASVFLHASGLSFSNFLDEQLSLETMLGANRLPLTLLVNEQGRVLAKIYGAREWDAPASLVLIDQHFSTKSARK